MTRISMKVSPETHDRLNDLRMEHHFSSFDETINYIHEELQEHQYTVTRQNQEILMLRQKTRELEVILKAQRSLENAQAVSGKMFDGFLGIMELFVEELREHVVPDDKKGAFVNPFSMEEEECRRVYEYLAPTLREVATDIRQKELEAKQMDAAYRKGRRHVEAPGGEGAAQ